MALPQYWLSVNRKDLAERAIIAKREQEAQNARKHESVARYHRDLNRLSSQYKSLEESTPGRSPRINQESSLQEEAKEKKRAKVYERQQKLALLIAEENNDYLKELKEISDKEENTDPWNIAKLKEQIEDLRKRRKHDEELLRKRNMYHLYHPKDIPFETERGKTDLRKEVLDAWEKQKIELERQANERNEEEKRMKEKLMEERLAASQSASAAETAILETKMKFKKKFRELSALIEENTNKMDKQKKNTSILEKNQKLIQDVIEKRKKVKEIQTQREQRIEMFRPSKEKVRKMATEVRHLLDVDSSALNYLIQFEGSDKESITSLDVQDVLSAKESIAERLSREEERDSELAVLFEEEAVKLWNCRKQLWDKELAMHEKIMSCLFETIQAQIERKLSECLSSRQQMIETQQKLLDELENENEQSKKHEMELAEMRDFYFNKAKELDDRVNMSVSSSKLPKSTTQLP